MLKGILKLLVVLILIISCKNNTSIPKTEKQYQNSVSLLAVGDVMLDRGTEKIVRKTYPFYPFEKMSPLIKKYNIAFCNLESIISDKGHPIKKPITFEADPRMLDILLKSGFNLINLANNHALDYGRRALLDCIRRLRKKGFKTLGAGNTLHEAYKPLILKVNSIKIAFLSYCTIPTGVPIRKNLPQTAVFNKDTAKYYLKKLKDSVNFIVVSMHWGTEYTHRPNPRQRRIAHFLIDNGADIVIGHHPHVVQEIEYYHSGLIIYSLGNFIFDQRGKERNEGIIFTCKLTKNGIKDVVFIPYKIKRAQPEFLTHEEKVDFIRRYRHILKVP